MTESVGIPRKTSEAALDDLALELAMNYLDTSISSDDLENRRAERAAETFEVVPDELPGHSRNVLVLGAGASLAAFGPDAFPGARDAMGRIDRQLGDQPEAIKKRIASEKERLQLAYGNMEVAEDFETHLAILSSIYSPGEIANILGRMYGARYWPHLTFELIAHMLKHRFVDVVINLNFDELLDQAIQEELGGSQFFHVISDGDCQTIEDIMVRRRLKVPVHVKPHGTARHRSSLRFTKEHYSTLPDNMREFVQKIIAGFTDNEGLRQPYRTNIISVGFGMGSLDLTQMLRFSAADRTKRGQNVDIKIYHINLASFRQTIEALGSVITVKEHLLIDVDAFGGLHGTLRALVDRVGSRFKEPYRPRGTARHEFVHQLFVDEDAQERIPAGRREARFDLAYYKARLAAELVLSLAKGRGRVDLAAMVDDRIGIYFDQLRKKAEKSGIERSISLDDVIQLFKSRPLLIGGLDHSILSAANSHDVSDRDLGSWLWKALCEALDNIGNDDISRRVAELRENSQGPRSPASLLQELVNSDTRDINADFRHRHLLLSSEPDLDEVLHTNLSYSLKFADMVTDEWQVMLAVSEYGRVLDRCAALAPDKLARRRFCIVLAESGRMDDTEERIESFRAKLGGGSDALRVFWLPFELHNHHMVITLKRPPNTTNPSAKWERTHAIRYDRKGLSNRINPVYLEKSDAADLKRLVESFFGYVTKAVRTGSTRNSRIASRYEDEVDQDVNAAVREALDPERAVREILLDHWWKLFEAPSWKHGP